MATYGNISNPQSTVNALVQRGQNAASAQLQQLARQLANQIVAERDAQKAAAKTGRVYTMFDPSDDILSNNVATVTTGLFSGNTGSLTAMVSASGQTAAQASYFRTINDVQNGISQFSIAYGNFNGSGSRDTTGNLNNDTPSRAIYKQYAQLLLAPNDLKFTIGGTDTNSIYVMNFNRARFKEKLDPGNIEINLRHLNGAAEGVPTGNSNLTLIDDSSLTSGTVGESGRIYNILSGSIDGGGTSIFNNTNDHTYGLLYPEYGIVVLDGDKLDLTGARGANFGTQQGSATDGKNIQRFYNSLSGSNSIPAAATRTYGVQARSSEQVKSSYYFVRVKNGEYNYSNNPSFVTGSLGELKFTTFIENPTSYITTVGLYNDNRELLAVAKLSQPLLKDKTKEVLIKVKLDF